MESSESKIEELIEASCKKLEDLSVNLEQLKRPHLSHHLHATLNFSTSPDNQAAFITLTPPLKDIDHFLTLEGIKNILVKEYKIRTQIKEENIIAALSGANFNTPILVATGNKGEKGAPAKITYSLPDGRRVDKGSLLLIVEAPKKGEGGVDVFGNPTEGELGEPLLISTKGEIYLFERGEGDNPEEKRTYAVALKSGKIYYSKREDSHLELSLEEEIEEFDSVEDNIFSPNNVRIRGDVEGRIIEAVGDVIIEGNIKDCSIRCRNLEVYGEIKGERLNSRIIAEEVIVEGNIKKSRIIAKNLTIKRQTATIEESHLSVQNTLRLPQLGNKAGSSSQLTTLELGENGVLIIEKDFYPKGVNIKIGTLTSLPSKKKLNKLVLFLEKGQLKSLPLTQFLPKDSEEEPLAYIILEIKDAESLESAKEQAAKLLDLSSFSHYLFSDSKLFLFKDSKKEARSFFSPPIFSWFPTKKGLYFIIYPHPYKTKVPNLSLILKELKNNGIELSPLSTERLEEFLKKEENPAELKSIILELPEYLPKIHGEIKLSWDKEEKELFLKVIYPLGSYGAIYPSYEVLRNKLEGSGVAKEAIIPEVLEELAKEEKNWDKEIKVAAYTPPFGGNYAKLEYFYNLEEEVREGQILAIIKRIEGRAGYTVFGNPIPPPLVKEENHHLLAGHNVGYDEEYGVLYALRRGKATYIEEEIEEGKLIRFDVHQEYEFPKITNKDLSLEGSVRVGSIQKVNLELTGNLYVDEIKESQIKLKGMLFSKSITQSKVISELGVNCELVESSLIEAKEARVKVEDVVKGDTHIIARELIVKGKKGSIIPPLKGNIIIEVEKYLYADNLGNQKGELIINTSKEANLAINKVLYPPVLIKTPSSSLKIKKKMNHFSISVAKSIISTKEFSAKSPQPLFTPRLNPQKEVRFPYSLVFEVNSPKEILESQNYRIATEILGKEINCKLISRREEKYLFRLFKKGEEKFFESKPQETLSSKEGEENREPQILSSSGIKLDLEITEKKDKAFLVINPPPSGGSLLTIEETINFLRKEGIKTPIIEENIKEALRKEKFFSPFLVSESIPPIPGKDAYIEYVVDLNPQLKEDKQGRINLRELKLIVNVEEGTLLARKHPGVEGIPGMLVDGEPIPVPPPKEVNLPAGRNTIISEDSEELYAGCSGGLTLQDGLLHIDPVYIVKGDLKESNIYFLGNVVIEGNVEHNFIVEAGGSIDIKGSVSKAVLKAGGDILISGGIHGDGSTLCEAKGNIITKFVEGATLWAKNIIVSEEVLHSKLYAENEIIVSSKESKIIGGELQAYHRIRGGEFGSPLEITTKLEVGLPPKLRQKWHTLATSIKEDKKRLVQISQLLGNKNQFLEDLKQKSNLTALSETSQNKLKKLMQKMLRLQNILSKRIEEKKYEIEDLKAKFSRYSDRKAIIEVKKKVNKGVELTLIQASLRLENSLEKEGVFCLSPEATISFNSL